MNIEIIDYDTYKRLNYDSVFKDYHNDSYRILQDIYDKMKINCGEVEIYCMDNSFEILLQKNSIKGGEMP